MLAGDLVGVSGNSCAGWGEVEGGVHDELPLRSGVGPFV